MGIDDLVIWFSALIFIALVGALLISETSTESQSTNYDCTHNLEKSCYIASNNIVLRGDVRTSCSNHHDYYLETYTTTSSGATACYKNWTKRYE